jgi:2-(1,2-epoxy-1,2-dihydrophenyl)acetyl-CoA isomerase
MTEHLSFGDVSVVIGGGHVATVEIHRPPNNYFDFELIHSLGNAYEALEERDDCWAAVLCSEGKHFCAGADFPAAGSAGAATGIPGILELYEEATRLFDCGVPVVAAVQGAAVGGGLGLACAADFRVATPESRFTANFSRLGFHHGFGLSVTLPAIVGQQRALEMLCTGRHVRGPEALEIGLCERLEEGEGLRRAAIDFAAEIAKSAPLAVRSIRETMREGLVSRLKPALEREASEQERLRATMDWAEGVRAMAERREPRFEGR